MSKEQVDALQAALRAEHAIIWAYGDIGAHAAVQRQDQVASVELRHRQRRDAIQTLLVAAGAVPDPSEPAYQLPKPVTNPTDAIEVAGMLEDKVAAAWRYVLGRSTDLDVRTLAVDSLIDAATQALRWRQVVSGTQATTQAFPGFDE
ncbi:uncharacterized protein DUF4439 [Antricoccus suffuscus]|uniref:Uncharacterized protein DUF4439 n=1 Tax=Antricoccus suffuscus TaxID=1629062 RepID=A0A2T1A4P0_9ACTN|nr:ferritin-like domain-containing protein [Antricoccus suffuscus]PRZ43563.1 uncharacterized protein DUF4439 [Antricoccus suffuscus]